MFSDRYKKIFALYVCVFSCHYSVNCLWSLWVFKGTVSIIQLAQISWDVFEKKPR
jgi:hypothetical protein